MTGTATAELTERGIRLTRVYDAPRVRVWEAWTQAEQIGRWWGPRGFTTTTHEMDVRPGGTWRFVMHGPDGTDYPNRTDYREVVRLERLAYRHSDGSEDDPGAFDVVVTFADEAGGTRVTMESVFASAEARDRVVEESGAIEGGQQTLDRLGEHLATM